MRQKQWEKERWSEAAKKKKSFTLRPLPRPRAGSRTEPTTSLHGACPLCYSNSLVTVLNPRGSLTQALGSQAWLLTAPRWKALDIALHVTYSPGLAKSLETSAPPWCVRTSLCLGLGMPRYCITAFSRCEAGVHLLCQHIIKHMTFQRLVWMHKW